jgi:hypothetical protein
VRFPITLYVDKLEFEPDVFTGKTVRTAYDLEITEYDAKVLYEELGKRLDKRPMTPVRIRVIGRLVS